MDAVLNSAFTLVGVVVGVVLTSFLQRRAAREAAAATRDQQLRDAFAATVAQFAAEIAELMRLQFDRARARIEDADDEGRERRRQAVYAQRAVTQSAFYRMQLAVDSDDEETVPAAKEALDRTRAIATGTMTTAQLGYANRSAGSALDEFAKVANRRLTRTARPR